MLRAEINELNARKPYTAGNMDYDQLNQKYEALKAANTKTITELRSYQLLHIQSIKHGKENVDLKSKM